MAEAVAAVRTWESADGRYIIRWNPLNSLTIEDTTAHVTVGFWEGDEVTYEQETNEFEFMNRLFLLKLEEDNGTFKIRLTSGNALFNQGIEYNFAIMTISEEVWNRLVEIGEGFFTEAYAIAQENPNANANANVNANANASAPVNALVNPSANTRGSVSGFPALGGGLRRRTHRHRTHRRRTHRRRTHRRRTHRRRTHRRRTHRRRTHRRRTHRRRTHRRRS